MQISRTLFPALVAVGIALTATGCSSDVEAPAAPIPEPAMVPVAVPVHDRTVDVLVWAPEDADHRHLVIISHGFAGDATSHAPLAEVLVDAGYTVAAPTHPDLAGLESTQPGLDPLTLRPRHVSLAIDHLEETDGPFESVTIVGHSLGSYTALRLVGASPSGDGLDAHCASNPQDLVLCTANARARFDVLSLDPSDAADSRISRAVLLAPGYGPLFSSTDLTAVAVPVMVVEAEADAELPGDQVQQLVNRFPTRPEFSSVPGGHYVFLRTCTAEESANLPDLCTDPGDADRALAAEQLAKDIDRFIASE